MPGCDFSYTLKHTQTYSLRGRSQRILESTTVEEYSYVYTGGNLMQMVLKTTTTPVGGTATTTTETLHFATQHPIEYPKEATRFHSEPGHFYAIHRQIISKNSKCSGKNR